MPKKKHSKKKKIQRVAVKQSKLTFFEINFIITLVLFILLYILYKYNPGYNFFVNRQIIYGSKQVYQHFDATLDFKYYLKLRNDYNFVNFIKDNTPDSAIILMPPEEVFRGSLLNMNGNWGVKSKIWSTYFLYPRILIQENERNAYPQMYERITHVMIVNGWGYEKLNYKVSKQEKYSVLPVNQTGIK